MYIIGMRYGKNIEKLDLTPTEILVGVVIPFVLFWGGMLSPFYTSDIFVWTFSLVPFYGYLTVCSFMKKETEERIVLVPSILNMATSVLLLVLFFFVPGEFVALGNTCKMGVVNILPSVLFSMFISIDCTVKGFCGLPFPLVPFIADDDS